MIFKLLLGKNKKKNISANRSVKKYCKKGKERQDETKEIGTKEADRHSPPPYCRGEGKRQAEEKDRA